MALDWSPLSAQGKKRKNNWVMGIAAVQSFDSFCLFSYLYTKPLSILRTLWYIPEDKLLKTYTYM